MNTHGEGVNVTRIRLGAGVVLLSALYAQYATIKGIATYGGAGLYNLTSTDTNVEGMFIIEDINAFGYTGTYIGHCFNNAPEWYFRRMILHGALTSTGERQSVAG